MIAVMFGVPPTAEGFDSYLDHAARLRPLLNQMDRFISIERFRSISDEGKCCTTCCWPNDGRSLVNPALATTPSPRLAQESHRDRCSAQLFFVCLNKVRSTA